jgi:ketosteroid isomerase-like protein
MSEESVDLVRTMCEAFIGGDIETALAKLDPEIEWHGTVGGMDEGQIFRGHREVIEAFVKAAEAWESQSLEVTEYIDAGDGRVLTLWHEVSRGRTSGAEVETETAVIYGVEGGMVVRADPFMDRDKALEAAGLAG